MLMFVVWVLLLPTEAISVVKLLYFVSHKSVDSVFTARAQKPMVSRF